MQLDASQQRAVDLLVESGFGIITGGPGTGKTTCLRTALDRLDELGVSYALASPTGKAARRMSEATGREALTVHRLLEYDPRARGYGKRDGFLRDAENPLEAELVVVDESSMLDVELAAALFDACRLFYDFDSEREKRTRLVLVGDKDQLPPVGAGRVFADLIESELVPVARLTTLHRSAAESWVATQSREILAGRVPDLAGRADFMWVEREGRDEAVEALVELLTTDPEQWASGVQVLIPQRVGPAGADLVNRRLQELLNPPNERTGPGWKVGKERIHVGDSVIQTRNDYLLNGGLGVMNGECGVVDTIDDSLLYVRFDPEARDGGRLVSYSKDAAKSLALAYALTTHKSQGSEWPWVVVLVHSTHTQMLTRGLFYTAVTRARKGVVVVGDRKGIQRAVKNGKDQRRNSGLIHRLRELGAGSEVAA